MTEVLTYEALKEKCDRLEQINAQTLQVKLTMAETIKEQTDRVNALAVENAALKARAVTVPAKVYVKDMRCNVVRWAQVVDALSEAGVAFVRDDGDLIAGTRETPATDAALAEIKAQGLDELANACDGYAENHVYTFTKRHAEEFAAQLREAK
ncbi:hypothetical protein ABA78_07875 [Serratia sp. TEL]|nr:hypothetical protein ABA78_07875 [Serratia sp. TEL]